MPLLAITDNGGWHLGIGDPTVMGWATVLAYLLASGICARVAFLHRRRAERKAFLRFWAALAVCLAALGANKQLDLQTWLTDVAREFALHGGWYEKRRDAQHIFIAGIAITGFSVIAGLWWRLQGSLRAVWSMLLGFTLLLCFLCLRAVSFHHVDEWLGTRIEGLRLSGVIELGVVLWIALSAWVNLRQLKATLSGAAPSQSHS